jgi:hypothetical protein
MGNDMAAGRRRRGDQMSTAPNVTELKRGHFYEGAKHGHLLSKFI